jgi:hypothetical protein
MLGERGCDLKSQPFLFSAQSARNEKVVSLEFLARWGYSGQALFQTETYGN